MTLECIWADGSQGNWFQTAQYAENIQGRNSDAIRGRGYGGLNYPTLDSKMHTAVAEGRVASIEINCRLNNQGNYIPFTQVLNGNYDNELRQRANEIAALGFASGGRKHMLEVQSEADLAKHYSGTKAEFRAFQEYVKTIYESEGVNNVLYTLSLMQQGYEASDAVVSDWFNFDVIDIAAADGYSTPAKSFNGQMPGNIQSFSAMFNPCRVFAAAHGLGWAVCETGCQENPVNANYKANWIAEKQSYLEAHPECFLVNDNYSDDGPSGGWPWYFDSSAPSLAAHITYINSTVFDQGGGDTWTRGAAVAGAGTVVADGFVTTGPGGALVRTPRGSYNDTVAATSYSTPPGETPAANELLVAWVTNSDITTPSEVTPSGWGLTWTVEKTILHPDSQSRLTLCVAETGTTSPGSGFFTASVAAGTGNQSGCIINVVGYSDTAGTLPVLVQSAVDLT